jgi:hypothetical protein
MSRARGGGEREGGGGGERRGGGRRSKGFGWSACLEVGRGGGEVLGEGEGLHGCSVPHCR